MKENRILQWLKQNVNGRKEVVMSEHLIVKREKGKGREGD